MKIVFTAQSKGEYCFIKLVFRLCVCAYVCVYSGWSIECIFCCGYDTEFTHQRKALIISCGRGFSKAGCPTHSTRTSLGFMSHGM